MTINLKQQTLFICFLLFLVILSFKVFAQTNDSTQLNLTTQKFFNCFTFDLPNNLIRTTDPEGESWTKVINYANAKDSVDLTIRQQYGSSNLNEMKKLNENKATSSYNIKMLKNEIENINGKDVLVFLMVGNWNGAKTQSKWLNCFVSSNNLTYQFLFKFPNNCKSYTDELLNEMTKSIKVCKSL